LISIDVIENKKGEHFVLDNPDDFPVEVLDLQPDLRHLLLLVRGQSNRGQKDIHTPGIFILTMTRMIH